jgi:hypothetical protein
MWSASSPVFWAIVAVLSPIAIILIFIAAKFLWGLWPLVASMAITGYGIYRLGFEWFWLIAAGIAIGIVLTWLWQRNTLFLKLDRKLEKIMMISD